MMSMRNGRRPVAMSSWLFLVLMMAAHQTINIVNATGKGSRGVFLISERYALISESSVDVFVVVDLKMGGVVETVRLHSPENDPQSIQDGKAPLSEISSSLIRAPFEAHHDYVNAVGVASCYECDYFYFNCFGGNRLYKAQMKASWRSMVEQDDFSAFAAVDYTKDFIPLQQTDIIRTSRGIEVPKQGGRAYLADVNTGLWLLEDGVEHFMSLSDMKLNEAAGLALSANEEQLYVASFDHVAIVDIATRQLLYRLDFSTDAFDDEERPRFRALTADDDGQHAYLFSHPFRGLHAMAFYRFSLERSNENAPVSKPVFVENLAGNVSDYENKWIDGPGSEARFTRPHDLHFMGTDQETGIKRIIASDIDNRGLRIVEVNMSATPKPSTETFSIDYDDGLWWDVYLKNNKMSTDQDADENVHEGDDISSDNDDETSNDDNISDDDYTESIEDEENGEGIAGVDQDSEDDYTLINTKKVITFFQPDDTALETTSSNSPLRTHHEMQQMCEASRSGGRLCHAKEIRKDYSQVWNLVSSKNAGGSSRLAGEEQFMFWTGTSCHACWLHHAGYCPTMPEIDEAEKNPDIDVTLPYWGRGVFMAAIMTNGGTFGMKGQAMQYMCTLGNNTATLATKTQEITPLCCLEDTVDNGNDNDNDNDDEGEQEDFDEDDEWVNVIVEEPGRTHGWSTSMLAVALVLAVLSLVYIGVKKVQKRQHRLQGRSHSCKNMYKELVHDSFEMSDECCDDDIMSDEDDNDNQNMGDII